jgi:hypothetical protein
MVAGQAVDLMFSIMPNAGVVVVARGPAARRLLLLFSSDGPPGSFRVEPVKPR